MFEHSFPFIEDLELNIETDVCLFIEASRNTECLPCRIKNNISATAICAGGQNLVEWITQVNAT